MSTLKIRKVGNSLGVIFPKELQENLNISEGDILDVTTVAGNKIILDSRLPHHSHWVFQDVESGAEDQEWLQADLEEDDEKPPRW